MSGLSQYFRSQADWRRGKAEEYPDDARNAQSAEALEQSVSRDISRTEQN